MAQMQEGSGWSGEAVGGGEEAREAAAADYESFQFLLYGVKPVDKAGRLPDGCTCGDNGGEGNDVGLEAWIATEETVEVADDVLVTAA